VRRRHDVAEVHHINLEGCYGNNSQSVFNEVKRAIEANGSMDRNERDRLMLMAITCVFFEVQRIQTQRKFVNDTIIKAIIGTIIALVVGYIWAKVVGGF